jgi:hypothetical protein
LPTTFLATAKQRKPRFSLLLFRPEIFLPTESSPFYISSRPPFSGKLFFGPKILFPCAHGCNVDVDCRPSTRTRADGFLPISLSPPPKHWF